MKKISRFLFVILFFGYLFFFGRPVSKETSVSPVWYGNTEEAILTPLPDEGNVFPFQTARQFGYMNREGVVTYIDNITGGIALSDESFVSFSTPEDPLSVYSHRGEFRYTIQSPGYPMFADGNLILLSGDRTKMTGIDNKGEPLFSRTYGSLITSVAANSRSVLIGTLDGEIDVFTPGSDSVISIVLEESLHNVIYGSAVSSSGNYLAVVSGIGPRILLLLEKRNGDYRKMHQWELEDDLRRNTLVQFSDDESLLFAEGDGKLHMFPVKSRRPDSLITIDIPGVLAWLVHPLKDEPVSMIIRKPDAVVFLLIGEEGEQISRNTYPGQVFNYRRYQNSHFITGENSFFRLDMRMQ